jgi:ankyrin repeat protein
MKHYLDAISYNSIPAYISYINELGVKLNSPSSTSREKTEIKKHLDAELVSTIYDDNISLEAVETLLNAGADVNSKDTSGVTILHMAVFKNNFKLLEIVLEKEVDMDVKTIGGRTPLHYAANWGYTEQLLALLNKGANVNVQDSDDNTPLHLAANHGDIKVVVALLENGANMNISNKEGVTPLYAAAIGDDFAQSVQHAIDKGQNDNIPPYYENAKKWCKQIIKILLEKGADIQSSLPKNLTPEQTSQLEKYFYDIEAGEDTTAPQASDAADITANRDSQSTQSPEPSAEYPDDEHELSTQVEAPIEEY